MAELSNGKSGDLYLAVRLDVLRKEPEAGMIGRGHVAMNSDMGLLWGEVAAELILKKNQSNTIPIF